MNTLTKVSQQVLLGSAVRENHALEHATIVLLSKKFPDTRFAGISFAPGFFVFGDVPTEEILPVAQEALSRLRGSEPEMAVHERCGTNLAVGGILTGLAAMAVAKMRRPYGIASNVILASTGALILARPVGLLVQKYFTTKTPNPTVRITGVKKMRFLNADAHFVSTENNESSRLFS